MKFLMAQADSKRYSQALQRLTKQPLEASKILCFYHSAEVSRCLRASILSVLQAIGITSRYQVPPRPGQQTIESQLVQARCCRLQVSFQFDGGLDAPRRERSRG